MWTKRILAAGSGTFGTTDDSLQFGGAVIVSMLNQPLQDVHCPDITDSQSVMTDVFFLNGNTQSVYFGSSNLATHPIQVSVGGTVQTVNAGGMVNVYFPPGAYKYILTRETGEIIQSNVIQDSPAGPGSPTSPTGTATETSSVIPNTRF